MTLFRAIEICRELGYQVKIVEQKVKVEGHLLMPEDEFIDWIKRTATFRTSLRPEDLK